MAGHFARFQSSPSTLSSVRVPTMRGIQVTGLLPAMK